jgi:hypothetical protein
MILSIILWAILITATLFLVIIASPIRFRGTLSYSKSGRETKYGFRISYIHPMIYRYEQSPEDEHPRTFIFGFERKPESVDEYGGEPAGAYKKHADKNGKPANTNKKRTDTDDKPAGTDSRRAETEYGDNRWSGAEEKSDERRGSRKRADEDGAVNAKPARPKRKSLLSGIKKRVAGVRSNRYYALINDKPLRKKLLRWFRRLAACVTKTVSFDNFRLRARIGYSDPAALGRTYGYFIAARDALELRNRSVDLAMEPVFTEECFDIDTEAAGRTTISVILWYLLAAACTFPYIRVFGARKKSRR